MLDVLVLNGGSNIHHVMAFVLTQNGFHAQAVETPQDAYDHLLSATQPHIILLLNDGRPKQSIYEMLMTIEKDHRLHQHPVILFSAVQERLADPFFTLAESIHATILYEPFSLPALVATIEAVSHQEPST